VRTYILQRLLMFIPIMLAVYTLVFIVMHATPGGPWDNTERPLPEATLNNLREKYGLNDPLWKQYLNYLIGIVTRFDFGPSLKGGRDANEIIRDTFPVSLQLGLVAFVISLVAGITLGVIAAIKPNTWVDYLAMLFSVMGISTPPYVITTLLIVLLAVQLRLLPTGGWGGLFDVRIIIPAFTLALGPTAALARYMRASLLEVISADYVRTARAKGLGERIVIIRHALRNALIPVLTISGPLLTSLITGSFFVESISQVPGLGRFFVRTVLDLDYPILIATTLLYAALVWSMNFIVDVLYTYLDPRVGYE
jgi:oligopeptide transport system permease protein